MLSIYNIKKRELFWISYVSSISMFIWCVISTSAISSDDNSYPTKYARVRDLQFIPNIENPRALTLTTHYDKNHPQLTMMDKTVYCTCYTKWT